MRTNNKRETRSQPAATRRRAASCDILGRRQQRAKIDPRWRRHYRHLLGLRDFFRQQKGLLNADANEQHPAFSLHPADAATDSFDRDVALGMLSSDQNALFEIESALRRIETGAYGICELTGKRIHPTRLLAIPWTRFSLEAEKQLESQGKVDRAHLGRATPLSDTAPLGDGANDEASDEGGG